MWKSKKAQGLPLGSINGELIGTERMADILTLFKLSKYFGHLTLGSFPPTAHHSGPSPPNADFLVQALHRAPALLPRDTHGHFPPGSFAWSHSLPVTLQAL